MELAYKGLSLSVPDSVYVPAEDSFMLADHAGELRGKILEIGTGSGLSSLCAALADASNTVLGVDINPSAVKCAESNAKRNGISNARFIVSDLFSGVPEGEFDAILFNPPYLPTSESEKIEAPLDQAFNGGEDGRQTVDRFLREFGSHLKAGGTLLLVQSSLNDPQKTEEKLRQLGYNVSIIAEEKFFFETLLLIQAVKP